MPISKPYYKNHAYAVDLASIRSLGPLKMRPAQAATKRLTSELLNEAVDGQKSTYWYLHGFRTGRGEEMHEPPPPWQFGNSRAWRRGKAHAVKYGPVLMVPLSAGRAIFFALFRSRPGST
jgi:hypothetical protein